MTIDTAAPMRVKIRRVRDAALAYADAALTYAIVRPPEATRRIPITVSCPNFTGFPQSRVSGQSGGNACCRHLPSRGDISTITWAGLLASRDDRFHHAVRHSDRLAGANWIYSVRCLRAGRLWRCLIFRPGAIAVFSLTAIPQPHDPQPRLLRVRSKLAIAAG
jgi:hypothetical protein